jgi:hypothetical protein
MPRVTMLWSEVDIKTIASSGIPIWPTAVIALWLMAVAHPTHLRLYSCGVVMHAVILLTGIRNVYFHMYAGTSEPQYESGAGRPRALTPEPDS